MIGELTSRSELSDADVTDMYRLFCEHFEQVTESRFREDLAQKDWVIRLHEGDRLHGFSSLCFMAVRCAERTFNVLYSGDTIVAPEARGTTVLARTWIQSVRRLAEHYAAADLHWLLLVSGFRTYRLLPVFWKDFYPRPSQATPAKVRDIIDSVSQSIFGPSYHAASGIVRFPEPQPLRPQFSHIPEGRLIDEHVRFFATLNPGHGEGDELVCWTRLSADNLTAAGRRVWHAGEPSRLGVPLEMNHPSPRRAVL